MHLAGGGTFNRTLVCVVLEMAHREGGQAKSGGRAAGGVDNRQVVEGGKGSKRAVVGNDQGTTDGLQHWQV